MSGALDLVVYHGRRTKQHYLSAQIELEILRTDNAALSARVSELDQAAQPVTLTPRQCVDGHECYRKGWDAAIEAAAGLLDARKLTLEEVQDGLEWSVDCPQVFARNIRALTPPDDCGDCNPLAPQTCNDILHRCSVCGAVADGPFYCSEHR